MSSIPTAKHARDLLNEKLEEHMENILHQINRQIFIAIHGLNSSITLDLKEVHEEVDRNKLVQKIQDLNYTVKRSTGFNGDKHIDSLYISW